MKKNLVMLICLLLTFLIVFSGCKSESADGSNQEVQETQNGLETVASNVETDGDFDARLDDFEKNLKEAGMKLGDRVSKDASALGATKGYGLNINDIPVEVYQFDKNSSEEWTVQNLKSAEESQTVTIFEVEVNGEVPTVECAVNDGLVVTFPLESMMPHPDKAEIVSIFNQL